MRVIGTVVLCAAIAMSCSSGLAQSKAQNQSATKNAPGAAADNGGQPDFTTVKIDFIPGEKTIFYDDFTDMAEDEPPPHWRVRDGKVQLEKSGAIRQMTTVCPSKISMDSSAFSFPKNFTVEIEAVFGNDNNDMHFYAWPKGVDGGQAGVWHIGIQPNNISFEGPNGDKFGSHSYSPALSKQPIKIAFWVQEGRARGYVNGERIVDVNQVVVPPSAKPADHFTVRERCDRPTDGYIALRSVRVAESAPDMGTVLSSTGKYVTHGITFDTNSDRLKLESAPVLKMASRELDKNPNLKLAIGGYTDSTGDAARNLDLSKRRAEAVKSVLVKQFGVDESRLTAAGYGAEKPVASNDTAEGRAQNRRVEFVKQ